MPLPAPFRDEQAANLPEFRLPTGVSSGRRVPPTLPDGSIAPRARKEREEDTGGSEGGDKVCGIVAATGSSRFGQARGII